MITAKMLFNSVISTPGARFMTMDISNVYLMTPLTHPEYLRVKLRDIPEEIIREYNLASLADPPALCTFSCRSACMVSHKQASLQTNYLKNASTHMGTSKASLSPASGTTISTPSSFPLWLTISESSTLAMKM
ncbi:hypothetical protein ACHAW6_004138 [Cyclotella cf. meneghiniana]